MTCELHDSMTATTPVYSTSQEKEDEAVEAKTRCNKELVQKDLTRVQDYLKNVLSL